MKKNKLFIIFIITALLLSGCKLPLYMPTSINTPMFTEKGQFNASASFGSGSNLQIAGSVTNNLALIGNFDYNEVSLESTFNNLTTKSIATQYMYEMGGGYFYTLNQDLMFEIFGLFGRGYADIDSKSTDIFRYALQTDIGFSRPNINLTFSLRMGYLNYATRLPTDYYPDYNLANKGGAFFMDPAFTIKVGGETLKFLVQFGKSRPLKFYPNDMWNHTWFLVGMNVSIHNKNSKLKPRISAKGK